ncbi:MAG: S-layer homology domain-containing protein [Firmicutes bacterium]|nr:S-layer homology domain-containing protein [Bacillota bacterium]
MPKKVRLSVFSLFTALIFIFQAAVFAEPSIIVTGDGTALLKGITTVAPGKPVSIFVHQKDGTSGGYFNDTVIERDGSYGMMFSLAGYDISKYDCIVNVAGKEKHIIPLVEGNLININLVSFDRDTLKAKISGELWNSTDFGKDFKLKIDSFVKIITVAADGSFSFEFDFADTGLAYGKYNFTVCSVSNELNKADGQIDLLSASGVLAAIEAASENAVLLKGVLSDTDNLEALGFNESVTFGDLTLDNAPDSFFENLAQIGVKTDSVANLKLSVMQAYALYLMETNPSESNIQKCAEVLGIADGDYKSIYDDSSFALNREAVISYIKDTDFITIDMFKNCFNNAVLLVGINSCKVWSELKNFAESNYQLIGINNSASALVWQNIILSAPFANVDAFKTCYYTEYNGASAGSGSGGSGGGGGNSSQAIGTFILGTPSVGAGNASAGNPSNGSNSIFNDVSDDHWASGYIKYLYERGIISGKGNGDFAPNDLVNRAEVAKLLCSSANLTPETSSEGHFSDVDSNHWAYGYIETAFKDGLLSGRGEKNFGISDFTTREDMAVFCYRLLSLINPEYVASINASDFDFSDAEDISEYAVKAVSAMVELGILKGKGDNKFYPKDYCTRAEAARIFFGVLVSGN